MSETDLGEELVRLASADNFRDVAGIDSAYLAADGVPLRRGVLFRSNELQLSDADAASVSAHGTTTRSRRTPTYRCRAPRGTTSRSRASRWTR